MSRWNWRSIAAISGSVAAMRAVWDAFAAVAAIGSCCRLGDETATATCRQVASAQSGGDSLPSSPDKGSRPPPAASGRALRGIHVGHSEGR